MCDSSSSPEKNQTATMADSNPEDVESLKKMFHDPVHGQIALHPLLVKIIDTPEFQRLRNIRQLGGVSFVYPGGCHTRFEHSIGVAYLAGELAKALKSKDSKLNITKKDILCVEIAGLCHDLGHGPFSHLYDNMFIPKVTRQNEGQAWKHEDASKKVFDRLVENQSVKDEMRRYGLTAGDITFIKEMINPNETKPEDTWPFKGREEGQSFLYEIVANKENGLDVDKFDYLERDCHHLGLRNIFDYRRFFLFARVCQVGKRYHICLREKELGNLYDMFYSRYSLHRRVYQHKVTKSVELMISDAFKAADSVLKLSETMKLENLDDYVELTDGVFEQILRSEDERMADAKKILQNIYKRKLYMCIGEAKKKNQPKEIQKEQEQQVMTELGKIVPAHELEAVSFKFDFGKGKQDPLDKTYFYNKNKPEEAFLIAREKRNVLLLKEFGEEMFRIYWKNTEDTNETLPKLREAFTTLTERLWNDTTPED